MCRLILCCCILGGFIVIFSFGDTDSLWFLRNLHNSNIVNDLYWNLVEEHKDDALLEGQDGATSGYGLNLLLINNIQTEQYAKELLQLCADNELGNLDTTSRDIYTTTEATLGMWFMEVNLYPNSVLLRSDLPWDDNAKAPVWNIQYGGFPASAMTLKGFDAGVAGVVGSQTSSGAAVGPLQFEPSSSGRLGVANCSGYSNSGRTKGDIYYTPDQITGLNNYLASAVSAMNFSDASLLEQSPNSIATMVSVTHNMGANGFVGVAGSKSLSAYADTSKLTDDKRIEITAKMSSDLLEQFNTVSDKSAIYDADNSHFVYIAAFLLIKAGWYIDDNLYSYLTKDSTINTAISLWNNVNPNDTVSTGSDLASKLSVHNKSLSDVTGYSTADCDATYGTSGGDYAASLPSTWSSQKKQGTLFYVYDEESEIYNSGSHKLVTAFSGIQSSHVASVVLEGGYRYACMLQYAGVNVDPTNPSTYYNSLNGEWTGSVAEQWMLDYGVDVNLLTAERKTILETAKVNVEKVQEAFGGQPGTYVFGANHSYTSSAPNYSAGFDCSSFVKWTYIMAGYSADTIPDTTAGYPGNANWIRKSWSEVKPGDALRREGHIVIYLGMSEDIVWTIEAKGSSYGVGYFQNNLTKINIDNASSDSKLTPYSYKNLN